LRKKDLFLENIVEISVLKPGQKVVVWVDCESDSQRRVKLFKGDIGSVIKVDGSGNALINFPGKDKEGSGNTMIKRSKFSNLRVELERSRPTEAPPAKRRRPTETAADEEAKKKAEEDAARVEKHKAQILAETTVTPEQHAKNEAAQVWLKKEPKSGTMRYTFRDPGPLGCRFSKDVPPWILSVNDGSPAAKKVPRVPVAGIVTHVNGHAITEKDCQEVMEGLKKRPVVLDVDWPVDQELPIVNRA